MYRIRFHGRGGQGMRTASRMLGNAFFAEGFEVQDAPRYGAERRGAPIFAYVRASHIPINDRGIIRHPDLVIVADETLIPIPAADVLFGASDRTVLLVHGEEKPEVWKERLNYPGTILSLPVGRIENRAEIPYLGAACVGAAAKLVGTISRQSLESGVLGELEGMEEDVRAANKAHALEAFDAMASHEGFIRESADLIPDGPLCPAWIDLPLEKADRSAPAVHGAATSVEVRTGLWRVLRPVIDYDHCNRCSWVCSTFCPDDAILVKDDRTPVIDYDHCKGCMICVAVCPPHAIRAIPETQAAKAEEGL